MLQLFSKRHKLVKTSFLYQEISQDIRNRLSNLIEKFYVYVSPYSEVLFGYNGYNHINNELEDQFFKIRHSSNSSHLSNIVFNFILKENWNRVFDLLEFLMCFRTKSGTNKENFQISLNKIFEEENLLYRSINYNITPITNEFEIRHIEEALSGKEKLYKKQLNHSLVLISERKSPDYRNSIKESISAVESICREITGESQLGPALKKLDIPKVLAVGMEKKYGWTNGPDGIRHALMEPESNAGFDEAKYFLISCSAFCNYLVAKQADK